MPKPILNSFVSTSSISLKALIMLLGWLVLISTVQAQDVRTWTGANNNNWRNNNNWNGGSSPGSNNEAIMASASNRTRVDLSNSSGNAVDRSVYRIQFRTNGNTTTIDDYFGPNQDLVANWVMERGRIVIPENTNPNIAGAQYLLWADRRNDRDSTTVLADIDLPAGRIFLSAIGDSAFSGTGTDAVETLNLYGNLSGGGTADLASRDASSAPYRSRLTLHEANDFSGLFIVGGTGDLLLRDDNALVNAAVEVNQNGILDFSSFDPVLDELVNNSEITVAGRTLTFGTREARSNNGTFVGGGRIRFVGDHPWTSTANENSFIGRVQTAGTAPFIAENTNTWANARIDIETDNGFAFTPNEARIGGLSGTGDLTLDANKVLRLVSDRFDLTYSGDLLGAGQLIQQNNRDWTFDGTSEGSIRVQSGTLSGNGTMADVTINPNARISPGASGAAGDIGSQRFINQLVVNGTMDVDIDEQGLDQFLVDGQLVLDGASLNVRIASFPSEPVFIFASYDERIGEFETVTGLLPSLDLRYDWGNLGQIALVQNVVPEANDDDYTFDQDVTLSGVNVLDNDTDGDFDTLTVVTAGTFTADGLGGTVTLGADGSLSYSPPPGLAGTATFSYTVEDNNGAQDTATVTLNVQNIVPEAVLDQFFLNEDEVLSGVNFLANDVDSPFDQLTVTSPTPGTYTLLGDAGSITYFANGDLAYEPGPDFFDNVGSDYEVGDLNGGRDVGRIQITVRAVNDAPSFTLAGDVEAFEEEALNAIPIVLDSSPGPANEQDQNLIFLIENNNPSLFQIQPIVEASTGNLSFTPALDAFGSAEVELTLLDDGGDANGGVDTSPPQTFTITISPINDAPSFTSVDPPTIDENAGPQTVNAWAVFEPGPDNENDQMVLEYLVDNISAPALFAIAPAIDAAGNLTYTPADDVSGSATFEARVRDNGGVANGGIDTSAPQTFTITINEVNAAPTFTASDPPSINEDAGAQTINGWAVFDPGSPNESGQAVLAYNVSNVSNTALFSVVPTVDINGNLSYTPADDAFGVSAFDVTVQDDGGTANGGVDTSSVQTFTITINSVNDAPTFFALGPPSMFEDAGPVTFSNWASFDAGAPDEGSQSVLAYSVSNVSNADLFSTPPAVSNDGTLSFTLAPDANGSTTFDVAVQDDGGTANGGDDTSDLQTFMITVLPVNDPPTFNHLNFLGVNANEDGDFLWAQNLRPGPADEFDQIVMFDITNVSNPKMFDQQPMIDSAGQLTFTFDVQDQGRVSSEVTVVAFDDGGMENGGVFEAEPVTFVIEAFPVADLTIDKTSGSSFVDPGGIITYTIVVTNNGPSEVLDAVVIDNPPPRLIDLQWTCAPEGDAFCDNASGTGPINELVSFLSNGSVIFTLQATLQDDMNMEPITNTASVATPSGVSEIDPSDNSDSDTDMVGLFIDSFESNEPD